MKSIYVPNPKLDLVLERKVDVPPTSSGARGPSLSI